MLPGSPATEFGWHDPRFDPLWRACVELGMPPSFHILTSRSDGDNPLEELAKEAGPNSNTVKTVSYGNRLIMALQNIVVQFVFGRVFERNPELKIVLVEADAGWAPHYLNRLNHSYNRHRFTIGAQDMKKLPGDYFRENIYLTFQDDWVALKNTDVLNPQRLLWANDYPHSDSTWPWSHELLAHHTKHLTDQEID
jgi:predicted TIM-barrel fold metal-dependent hydrolase